MCAKTLAVKYPHTHTLTHTHTQKKKRVLKQPEF